MKDVKKMFEDMMGVGQSTLEQGGGNVMVGKQLLVKVVEEVGLTPKPPPLRSP
jgi:hypothetical protein